MCWVTPERLLVTFALRLVGNASIATLVLDTSSWSGLCWMLSCRASVCAADAGEL